MQEFIAPIRAAIAGLSPTFRGSIAIAVVLMRWVDIYWLIAPAFFPGVRIGFLDILFFVLIGGIWFYAFLSQLMKRALLPLRDPNFIVENAA